MARFLELCLDTDRPDSRIADFWATVRGGTAVPGGAGQPLDVEGRSDDQSISVCVVPEPKTVKNRIHLDVYARSIDDLTALGAQVVLPSAESGFRWTVMLDPEGNEFCAF